MSEKANSGYLQYSALLNPFLDSVLDQASIPSFDYRIWIEDE